MFYNYKSVARFLSFNFQAERMQRRPVCELRIYYECLRVYLHACAKFQQLSNICSFLLNAFGIL